MEVEVPSDAMAAIPLVSIEIAQVAVEPPAPRRARCIHLRSLNAAGSSGNESGKHEGSLMPKSLCSAPVCIE
eukprot:6202792-Pleurochrysis_carterae.AAC.1